MTHAQHTPGPWETNSDDGEGVSIIGHPSGMKNQAKGTQHLATVVYNDRAQSDYFPYTPNHATARANANLIAAAPTLLAECKRAQDELATLIRDGGEPDKAMLQRWFNGVSAAINQAEGN